MSDAVDMSLTKDSAGRGYGHASWLMKTDATGCAADWLIVPFAESYDSLVHGTATDSQGNVYAVGSKCREATAEEKAQGATGGASEWGSAGTNVCSAFVGKYAAADGAALLAARELEIAQAHALDKKRRKKKQRKRKGNPKDF